MKIECFDKFVSDGQTERHCHTQGQYKKGGSISNVRGTRCYVKCDPPCLDGFLSLIGHSKQLELSHSAYAHLILDVCV